MVPTVSSLFFRQRHQARYEELKRKEQENGEEHEKLNSLNSKVYLLKRNSLNYRKKDEHEGINRKL